MGMIESKIERKSWRKPKIIQKMFTPPIILPIIIGVILEDECIRVPKPAYQSNGGRIHLSKKTVFAWESGVYYLIVVFH